MASRPGTADDSENRLLTGTLRSTLFLLALPVLGEQVLNFLVGFYDVYLAGHLAADVRTDATAAVGVAAYVGWLASLVFSLVATGTTALISRAWGAREFDHGNRVANRSVALGGLAGLVFIAIIIPVAPSLVSLMGLTGHAAEISVRYLRIDAIGLLFSSLGLVIAAALRGTGDMKTPMLIYSGVNVLNVVISTTLVYGLGPFEPWGVDGIVTGTVIARTIGGLTSLSLLSWGISGLQLRLNELRYRDEIVERILHIGLPTAAEGLIMWIGHVLFLRVISGIGSNEFAAHIVGVRVEAITYLPAVAWGAAAATMVGQSLGANNRQRAASAGHEAAFQCSLLGVVITLWFTLGAGSIYELMHDDPTVRAAGIPAFRMVGLFQIPLMLGIVYFSAMRGAGETRFAMWTSLVTTYLIRVPVGYFFGVVWGMGLYGAWIGMCLDMFARGAAAAGRYVSGKWLETRV